MNQEKIWEYHQDPSLSSSFDTNKGRLEFIAKKVKPTEKVLNIGVGNAYLEKLLIEKGTAISTIDPDANAIQLLEEQFKGSNNIAKVGYSQAIPFRDHSFDTVVMSEVLEHLTDDVIQQTLEEVARVLCPGGRYIGTVPANEDLSLSVVICPKCGDRFHRWGHHQSFTEEGLIGLLRKKFSNVKVNNVYLATNQGLNLKGQFIHFLKMIQSLIGKQGKNDHFYFECSHIIK